MSRKKYDIIECESGPSNFASNGCDKSRATSEFRGNSKSALRPTKYFASGTLAENTLYSDTLRSAYIEDSASRTISRDLSCDCDTTARSSEIYVIADAFFSNASITSSHYTTPFYLAE